MTVAVSSEDLLDSDTKTGSKVGTESTALSSPFLEHVATDAYCPCSKCLANLPPKAFWEGTLRAIAIHSYGFFAFFMPGWSPLVFYREVFWSSWWGLLLGTCFLLVLFLYAYGPIPEKWVRRNIPMIQLTTRLYHRATSLALYSLLERAKHEVWEPPQLSAEDQTAGRSRSVETETFVKLHNAYAAIWARQHALQNDTFVLLVITAAPVCFVVITLMNLVGTRW